jgi:hypothetical protein
MGRAEDLFDRLRESGEQAIDAMIEDRQSEELFLDFKRSADSGMGRKLHDGDRQNLAKAISGYGNSEGGVVIWGVDCRQEVEIGDVAKAKVPIHNPKRYVSWLEGAVSGCTVPPHPQVRHLAIESPSTNTGFAVTYVRKSYLAPHQCLKPLQYFIRAGSDFVPTPHAVLEGMFGRQPRPFVYHMWSLPPETLVQRPDGVVAIEFALGFQLSSYGPGVARDLYVNVMILPPKGGTKATFSHPDTENWTASVAFGITMNLMSKDSLKLPPWGLLQPVILQFSFAPPFTSDFRYEITFGHQASPVRKIEAKVTPATLQRTYDAFISTAGINDGSRKFINEVMAFEEHKKYGPDDYNR